MLGFETIATELSDMLEAEQFRRLGLDERFLPRVQDRGMDKSRVTCKSHVYASNWSMVSI
jgi:hypothetical protein